MSARIHIFLANYGSGKTEFALNYALKLKQEGKEVAVADLDVVNLYFRSRDLKDLFDSAGIRIISSARGYERADSPALSPEIFGAIQNEDMDLVLDVGGDSNGATVLGSFHKQLKDYDYNAFLVVNVNRPFTKSTEEVKEIYEMLEAKGRIKLTGLINNTNLQEFSTIENIKHGESILEQVAEDKCIPIVYSGVYDKLWDEVDALKYEAFKIQRFMRKPWESPATIPQDLKTK